MNIDELAEILTDFTVVIEKILEDKGFMALTDKELVDEYIKQKNEEGLHVLPNNEEHEKSPNCKCKPRLIFKNGVMIVTHNSFDGREYKEDLTSKTDLN